MRFFNRINRKGQSTLEYAVLIAGVVGAILILLHIYSGLPREDLRRLQIG